MMRVAQSNSGPPWSIESAARDGPECFGALISSRESLHGCLVECRAVNESRSPVLEDD